MLPEIKNFLLTYFWTPIVQEHIHYNIVNTLAYSLLFGILTIYIGYRIIKKLDIKIDRNFSLGISSYILLAAVIRSAEDIGALKSFFFTTPLIFFLLIPLVLVTLILSLYIEKKYDVAYQKTWFLSGLILSGFVLSVHVIRNLTGLLLVSGTVAIWIIPMIYLGKKKMFDLNRMEVFLPIAAHLWDASVTFISVKFFPFVEEHVLGSFLIQRFGAVAMFPMKILIIVPITYYGWKELDPEIRNYVLFLIALFGFGTGTRDFITLLSVFIP